MTYIKKNNYPSYKKSGVYPSGSIKELGLDNDNLEKFSLGNWNSVLRRNRVFVNQSMISVDDDQPSILENIPVYLTSPFFHEPSNDSFFRPTFYRFFAQIYGYYNDEGDFSSEPQEGYNSIMWNKLLYDENSITTPPYVLSYADLDSINPSGAPPSNSNIAMVFNDDNNNYDEVGENDDDVRQFMLDRQEELYDFLRTNPFFIEENPAFTPDTNIDDETYGSLTDENPIKLSFNENSQSQLNQILNNTLTRVVKLKGANNEVLDVIANLRLNIMFDRPKVDYLGNEIPKNRITVQNSDTNSLPGWEDTFWGYVFGLDQPDTLVEPSYSTFHPLHIGDATTLAEQVENGDFSDISYLFDYPVFLIDDKDDNNFFNAYIPSLLNEEFEGQIGSPNSNDYNNRITYLQTLGHPNYAVGEELENSPAPEQQIISSLGGEDVVSDFLDTIDYGIVDFEVQCRLSTDGDIQKNLSDSNNFLNYDFNDERYEQSSYPIKVDLTIDLFDAPNFVNEKINVDLSSYSNADSRLDHIISQIETASNPKQAYYRYQVVQWGDEAITLENDSFLQTPFFAMYEMDNYPPIEEFNYKVNKAEQANNSKAIIRRKGSQIIYNKKSHVYNTPGLKNIKIIVYRYTKDGLILLSTTLVSKNIIISDGALKSQDFSIFGGTDFNFLPIVNNQAIIGGFDENSKYNNSVSQLVKDDNFIEEDYLERVSSKDYIRKFNDGLLGKSPEQLDLSTTRIFRKPFDIYDFITDDKESIVDNNFNINTLPINSSATDIFISNEDCIIDLNPQDLEYLSIENKTGTADKAILIGDYKINQPQDGKIQREGVMKTPTLEDNQDKQAF